MPGKPTEQKKTDKKKTVTGKLKPTDDMLEAIEESSDMQMSQQEQLMDTIRSLESLKEQLLQLEKKVSDQDKNANDFREESREYLQTTFQESVQSKVEEFTVNAIEIETRLTDSEESIGEKLENIDEKLKKAEKRLADIDNLYNIHNNLTSFLEEKNKSYQQLYAEIEKYHDLFLIDDEKGDSRKTEIEDLVDDLNIKKKEISEYYNEIFGKYTIIEVPYDEQQHGGMTVFENEEGEKFVRIAKRKGGGKADLDSAINNWHEACLAQKNEQARLILEAERDYLELKYKIEDLLPEATSAGLSSAFFSARRDHTITTAIWGIGFLASLIGIIAVAYFMDFRVKIGSWEILLESLLQIAPFEFPLLWFAIFSSKRTKEHSRLQEEYLHKASVMRTFNGLRKEISEVGEHGSLGTLLDEAVKSNTFNPSETLEKTSSPDSPLTLVTENINEIKELITALKPYRNNKKSSVIATAATEEKDEA